MGGGEERESQRRSFFTMGCSEFVLFMCKSGDKNLKLVIKVNRVEQFSTVELFLMF